MPMFYFLQLVAGISINIQKVPPKITSEQQEPYLRFIKFVKLPYK
jgi:hypothetical protein